MNFAVMGKKLEKSIKCYNFGKKLHFPKGNKNLVIQRITDTTFELMVQREFLGFINENIQLIYQHYNIPLEAINRIGVKFK